MSYQAPHINLWLPLSQIEPFEALAERKGVSEVARSDEGFLSFYKAENGDPKALEKVFYSENQSWAQRRDNFVNRHMAQVDKNNEALWDKKGDPTRRHLALIMWAYSPDYPGVRSWLKKKI